MRALKDTTNSQASTTRKTTSSTSLYQPGVTYTNTANLYDHKTHIKINHGGKFYDHSIPKLFIRKN